MLFMVSSDAYFGGPDPMIAKGCIDECESITEAAIREAAEELGLKTSNVRYMEKGWSGELTGMQETYMFYVFAAEVKNPDDFNLPHYETAHTVWMTPKEFAALGRESQRHIVAAISKII